MKVNQTGNIVVAIYTHPELYPPVLNVIDELSDIFNNVFVLSRNLKKNRWKYPVNTSSITSGQFIDIRDSEKSPTWWKFKSFINYTWHFYRILKSARPEWVMCNDPISLYSFRLIRPFIGHRVRLWYHNHDVVELSGMRRFSIGYFAVKSETISFRRMDLFTLPSESRINYFPIEGFRGKYLVVPNYPSLRRINSGRKTEWKPGSDLKLLYQGYISDGHGLEQIIKYLQRDTTLKLTIIGPGDMIFKKYLRDRAGEMEVDDRVYIYDSVPYNELQEITLSHHIGLAIHEPVNVAFRTAAMASNKIYEYAASGLPVLYFKNEHYLEYLGKFKWAFPTDLSAQDLSNIIQEIRVQYHMLSNNAIEDFLNTLNFTIAFKPVIPILLGDTRVSK